MSKILGYLHELSAKQPISTLDEPLNLTVEESANIDDFSLDSLINEEIFLLFLADWLPFKKQLLESLSLHIQADLVLVDPEKSPLLVGRFNILTLPTLLHLSKGLEESRLVGAFGAHELNKLKTSPSR
jgi:hypothetical protein